MPAWCARHPDFATFLLTASVYGQRPPAAAETGPPGPVLGRVAWEQTSLSDLLRGAARATPVPPGLHLGLVVPLHQGHPRTPRHIRRLRGRIALGLAVLAVAVRGRGEPSPSAATRNHLLVMGLAMSALPFLLIGWSEEHISSAWPRS